VRHGHWSPDAATKKALAQRYAELTQIAPLAKDFPSVPNWVQRTLATKEHHATVQAKGVQKASEARPELPAPDASVAPTAEPEAASVQRGVFLERQVQTRVDDPHPLIGLAPIALPLAGSAVHQSLGGSVSDRAEAHEETAPFVTLDSPSAAVGILRPITYADPIVIRFRYRQGKCEERDDSSPDATCEGRHS
jgi:hypothetical protein